MKIQMTILLLATMLLSACGQQTTPVPPSPTITKTSIPVTPTLTSTPTVVPTPTLLLSSEYRLIPSSDGNGSFLEITTTNGSEIVPGLVVNSDGSGTVSINDESLAFEQITPQNFLVVGRVIFIGIGDQGVLHVTNEKLLREIISSGIQTSEQNKWVIVIMQAQVDDNGQYQIYTPSMVDQSSLAGCIPPLVDSEKSAIQIGVDKEKLLSELTPEVAGQRINAITLNCVAFAIVEGDAADRYSTMHDLFFNILGNELIFSFPDL